MRDTDHKPPTGNGETTLAARAPAFPAGWTPLHAWRLHTLYAPIVHALAALLVPGADAKAAARPRILQAGGHPGVLAAFLARSDGAPIECDVSMLADTPNAASKLDEHSYECVVAIDWLSLVAPSRRKQQLAALCRAARAGIILVNPFDSPEAAAAQRAVNDGYRAAHAADHPALGHLIEVGLPDLPTARGWVESFFPNVETRPIEHVTLWQTAASMAILEPESLRPPSAADIAAAALYPLPVEWIAAEPSYRTMVVAAIRPSPLATQRQPAASPARSELPALTMLAALEAGEHRRTLARLVEAIAAEREREREEFRAGVASLAGELRELESRAEFLARETREQERTAANLRAMLAGTEARADAEAAHAEAAETHARNLAALQMGAEARAEAAHTHARNLDSLRADAERRAGAAAARADTAETHARNMGAMRTEAEARAERAEARARETQARHAEAEKRVAAGETHSRNLDSLRADAERRAGAAAARVEAAETHARNLDSLRIEAERLAAAAVARIDAAETHARNLDSLRADAEQRAGAAASRADAAETHARNLDALRVRAEQVHETFLRSRAGRAYVSYTRMKRALTGRK